MKGKRINSIIKRMGFASPSFGFGKLPLLGILLCFFCILSQKSYADEINLVFGVDSISVSKDSFICEGSFLTFEIVGLDSGESYVFEYEIYGANIFTKRNFTVHSVDSIDKKELFSVQFINPGLDTIRIWTVGLLGTSPDSVPIENGLIFHEVLAKPEITVQPEGLEICLEEDFSISVETSDPSHTYQWLKKDRFDNTWQAINDNNNTYSGSTTDLLNVTDGANANYFIDENWYRVIVSNGVCEDLYSDSVQIVRDTTPPVAISCPSSDSIFLVGDICKIDYDFDQYINFLNYTDECSDFVSSLTVFRFYYGTNEEVPLEDSLRIGNTLIAVTVSDANGNLETCNINIVLVADDPDILVPDDIVAYADKDKCGTKVNFDRPEIITNCYYDDELKLQVDDHLSGEFFEVGNTTVYRYITHNNEILVSDNFQITVIDTSPPEIECPIDLEVRADKGKDFAVVNYQLPDVIDNCSYTELIPPADSLLSGYEFSLGTTIIEWGVKDAEDLVSTCEFTIIVKDEEAPILQCPFPIQVPVEPGKCDTLIFFNPPGVSDNDPSQVVLSHNLTDSYNPGDIISGRFHIGDSSIVWIGVDESGNTGTCSQEVSITPSIEANEDIASIFKNDTLTLNAYANDLYCEEYLSIHEINILQAPDSGTINIIDGMGNIEYIPNTEFIGVDSIQYQLCESGGTCEVAWIIIDVSAEVIPLEMRADTLITINGGSTNGNVIANDDFSKDSDFTMVVVGPTPANASSFQFDVTTGDVAYTPIVGYLDIDSFQYSICDFWGACDTATVYIWNLTDTDFDELANLFDDDDDDDGIMDEQEGDGDTDGDGIPNHLDIDSDNDGIVDNIEGQDEGFDIIVPLGEDSNNNGLDDAYDPEVGGVEIGFVDTDNDSTFDFLDEDSDGDNAPDLVEGNDANMDGLADVILSGSDADGDGLDDIFDIVDGFGTVGNATGTNVVLQDTDDDGTRDWRDLDDDGDSLTTLEEDINNNNDPSDDDSDIDDIPNYLDPVEYCEMVIPNGFSPNGDGIADYFYIRCINLYPDAKLIVFNRWGQKVYEKENYGNTNVWGEKDAYWDGTSNMGFTPVSGRLSPSTYLYILDFGDGSEVKKGTVFINRNADSMRF